MARGKIPIRRPTPINGKKPIQHTTGLKPRPGIITRRPIDHVKQKPIPSKIGNPKNRVIVRRPGPVPGHGLPIQRPRRPIQRPKKPIFIRRPINKPKPIQHTTGLKPRPGQNTRRLKKDKKGRVTIRKDGKTWVISINGVPKFRSSTKILAKSKAEQLRSIFKK